MCLHSMRRNHNGQRTCVLFHHEYGRCFCFCEALDWNGFIHLNLSGENGYSGCGSFGKEISTVSSAFVLKTGLVDCTSLEEVWKVFS